MARRRGYEGLSNNPVPLDHASCPEADARRACAPRLGPALELGEKHGYRNAQATVIAPTGTIGLVMDCDTTGIEPDFALVKFKKLAGGGYFKIINRAVPDALRTLGYREHEIAEIEAYAVGHGSMRQAPAVNPGVAARQGLHGREDRGVEKGLKSAFDIKFVFNKMDARRGLPHRHPEGAGREAERSRPSSCSPFLGFSKADIEAANVHVCGAMTLEGAPHPQDRALRRSSIAPIPAAASASATSRSRATSA